MNLPEMAAEFARLSKLLDNGLDAIRHHSYELAQAENTYRKARAAAWGQTDGVAKEREDAVNAITADERHRRDIADYLRHAALEAVRSRRTQVSALQTLLNAHQEEARFGRTA